MCSLSGEEKKPPSKVLAGGFRFNSVKYYLFSALAITRLR
jgi:hypothetical protein